MSRAQGDGELEGQISLNLAAATACNNVQSAISNENAMRFLRGAAVYCGMTLRLLYG